MKRRKKKTDGEGNGPKQRKHNQCGGEVNAPGTSDAKGSRGDAVTDAQTKAQEAAQGGCSAKSCTNGNCFYKENNLEVISVDPTADKKFIAKVITFGECQCE